MKRKLITTAILATLLVGSNAFATIARQAVLGGQPVFSNTGNGAAATTATNSVNGSLWYDDDYNVFYNPSYVNDNKNYVVVQKGFEGGFFKSEFENFAYGIYMNRGGFNTATSGWGGAAIGQYGAGFMAPGWGSRAGLTGTSTGIQTQRPIDLFFGGDTGLKWGFHVAWAYNRNQLQGSQAANNADAEITARYWHFDFGVQVMGFEPFIGTTAFTKYQNNVVSQLAGADLNEFDVGFRYKYEGWTPYFVYKKYRETGNSTSNANGAQAGERNHIFGLGVGHDTKVADGVHVLKNLGFWSNAVEDDTQAAGGANASGVVLTDVNRSYKDMVVPLNVAVEAEATSWLTLRAGATMDLFNNRKFANTNLTAGNTTNLADKNVSQAGATRFRVGSTLKFGKLHVDSAFGNGAAGATPGAEALDTSAAGFDGQTFALMSASYHW